MQVKTKHTSNKSFDNNTGKKNCNILNNMVVYVSAMSQQ